MSVSDVGAADTGVWSQFTYFVGQHQLQAGQVSANTSQTPATNIKLGL